MRRSLAASQSEQLLAVHFVTADILQSAGETKFTTDLTSIAKVDLLQMHTESFEIDTAVLSDGAIRTAESYTWITFYLACSTVWTAVLVTLPVSANVGPDNYYEGHSQWYTGDDVLRFIEPVGGLLWNSIILYHSGIIWKPLDERSMLLIGLYLFGCSLYLQGGAFHSAATMFKNALQTIRDDRDDDSLDALNYYIRNVWEHGVAHYLYAVGLIIMHMVIMYCYRDIRAPESGLSLVGRLLLTISCTAMAFLAFAVSLQFPSGTIVGFLYLFLYGICTLGGYLVYLYRNGERKALTEFGHLPVLHHFFVGYVVAFVGLLCWIIYKDGFESRTGQ